MRKKKTRITVCHSEYGCESGCCGHVVYMEGERGEFNFSHPNGKDPKEFAKRVVAEEFGEEHVADLDWDNCNIVDDR